MGVHGKFGIGLWRVYGRKGKRTGLAGLACVYQGDASQDFVSEGDAKVEPVVRIYGGGFLSQTDPRGGSLKKSPFTCAVVVDVSASGYDLATVP